MKSGALDSRIGDSIDAIVRDANLLLADTSNWNDEQREFADELQQSAVHLQSLYTAHLKDLSELTQDALAVIHDLRNPLGIIVGYCELLVIRDQDNLSASQVERLQQIKDAYTFIKDTFTLWLNEGMENTNNG